ncbi:MAG: thiamine diphosphokinase [Candidatus Marinimicrobia bacterium]|jgi:thiamine pyrophosphokinase|nr:thiamine diphosphokinase [Candidatus Neomarinimicrobiota bacterium]MBT3496893.1 thiamine diphosphokinase [Candidatus Neomarinimicrobiota bacterium]MBT3692028.1 thiamine diphosphokinase [Candidatus Neomarinimicrobiota bacterium]MBT3732856.1 thiamine diphosphokinase [Candidatus Neomarinimicrobiota bacterium]MBT4144724.1 thiamine diphosphokinase [Candidatus Neomarinimicrobiota bacterium]
MKRPISFRFPLAIVANGLFPSHNHPLDCLKKSGTIISIDGALDTCLQKGFHVSAVLGDMDSLDQRENEFNGLWIPLPNQNKTDLEKTLDWCLENGINRLTLLGATGLREDMTLANHYILFDYFNRLEITMVTDHFSISCHQGQQSFESFPGQTVSIIAYQEKTIVSSTALQFPLSQFVLEPSARAISNRSIGNTFSIDASKPFLVFRSHLEE